MSIFTLKDGSIIEDIPIGRAKIKIGMQSPDKMLTIVGRAPNNNGRAAKIICKCICGKYTVLTAQAFKLGTTKSCGCYNLQQKKELCKIVGRKSNSKDYTKIINPYYIFLQRLNEKDNNNSFYWKVKCKKCNQIYKIVPSQVISDTRRKGLNPCNCWKKQSKGALKIENILKENNIKYIKEKIFDTCLSPLNKKLKFDFYLPDYNILIEYDGEQHFFPMSFGDNKITGEDKLILNKKYDKIKNEWCKNNNFILIRIPYTQYKTICLQDLINGGENAK